MFREQDILWVTQCDWKRSLKWKCIAWLQCMVFEGFLSPGKKQQQHIFNLICFINTGVLLFSPLIRNWGNYSYISIRVYIQLKWTFISAVCSLLVVYIFLPLSSLLCVCMSLFFILVFFLSSLCHVCSWCVTNIDVWFQRKYFFTTNFKCQKHHSLYSETRTWNAKSWMEKKKEEELQLYLIFLPEINVDDDFQYIYLWRKRNSIIVCGSSRVDFTFFFLLKKYNTPHLLFHIPPFFSTPHLHSFFLLYLTNPYCIIHTHRIHLDWFRNLFFFHKISMKYYCYVNLKPFSAYWIFLPF